MSWYGTVSACARSGHVVVPVEDVDQWAEYALDLGEILVVAEFDQEGEQTQHLSV